MEKQRIAILFYMQASNSCFGVSCYLYFSAVTGADGHACTFAAGWSYLSIAGVG
jgi:hypothetical protein